MDAVLVGFIVYLLLVLVAGAATYRLTQTQEDFLLAGRRLNIWVATFSERASGESAWLLLGLPAAAATVGLVESWAAIGCVTGIMAAWFFVASGLRRETERVEAMTLPEFFARKFGEHAAPIRVVAAAIIIFFYAFYLAAQFNGAGAVLEATFGIDRFVGMVIGASVIILYTMMGGFFAVAWTDFLQALIMIGTLVVLPIVGLLELSHHQASFPLSPDVRSWTGSATGLAGVAAVISGLSWGFGYCGQPHTVTRFMSIDRPKHIRIGRIIAFFWAAPAFAGALAIGLIGAQLFDVSALEQAGTIEQLMPLMAKDLLPAWLAGIFVSGAVAAMMSTADSQLLVGTSAVAEDVIHRGFGVKLGHKGLVVLSRWVTVILGVAAFVLAASSETLIFTLVSYAWSGLGSSFGPAILLTLHWRRTTGLGVLVGMVTGATVTVVWSWLPLNDLIHARLVSFVLAALSVVGVSLLGPRKTSGPGQRTEAAG
ncbi:MAG: sodium/proline symporter [Myxococcota bacterium]